MGDQHPPLRAAQIPRRNQTTASLGSRRCQSGCLVELLLEPAHLVHDPRLSYGVVEDQVEAILDVWYGVVGSTPHLLAAFSAKRDGKPLAEYLEAVRKRFGQWIRCVTHGSGTFHERGSLRRACPCVQADRGRDDSRPVRRPQGKRDESAAVWWFLTEAKMIGGHVISQAFWRTPAAATIQLCALLAATIAAACSGSGSRARSTSCELASEDSVYLSAGPVFRNCAVDERARPMPSTGRLDFEPPRPPIVPRPGNRQCFSVELQFVVDTLGVPETRTVRVIRTNYLPMAEAVQAAVKDWRYQPARRDGAAVRQIVRERRELAVAVVAVSPGQAPPTPARRPSC